MRMTTSLKLKSEECKGCNGSSNDDKPSHHSTFCHHRHRHHNEDDGKHYNNKMVMAGLNALYAIAIKRKT